MVLSLLGTTKSFSDSWVGNPALNRWGLHRARVRGARAMASFRRAQCLPIESASEYELLTNGVVAIERFLPEATFAGLYAEVTRAAEAARLAVPYPAPSARGFGTQQPHDWGFDRFDGGTLNRLIKPTPLVLDFSAHPTLRRLARIVTGHRLKPTQCQIYETINHSDEHNPDIQATFHRDTFFDCMKFWFYLESVANEDGPFTYIPGSHRLTPARMDWENRCARRAVAAKKDGLGKGLGGSFRITDAELAGMSLPEPVAFAVEPNTLVIANVFGFHRRGDASKGARRLSIYANHRPFTPFGFIRS